MLVISLYIVSVVISDVHHVCVCVCVCVCVSVCTSSAALSLKRGQVMRGYTVNKILALEKGIAATVSVH